MSDVAPELPDPESTFEVSPGSVAQWVSLPPNQRPRLIDCRERDELDYCKIEGCEWVPLGAFPTSLEKLTADIDRGVVVYCHHGMRSLRAASILRANGVLKAFSMSGGIDEWSAFVDPNVPRY